MKQKLPAFILMMATPFSIVAYIKVAAMSGSELLGVAAAMGLYILVFILLALIFNSRNSDGGEPSPAPFDEMEATRNLAARLGKVADEAAEKENSKQVK